jgi:hypothetical protein
MLDRPVGHAASEVAMDFIEKIFGFAPDGGSGAFEVLLFLIPVVGLYLLYKRHTAARKPKD